MRIWVSNIRTGLRGQSKESPSGTADVSAFSGGAHTFQSTVLPVQRGLKNCQHTVHLFLVFTESLMYFLFVFFVLSTSATQRWCLNLNLIQCFKRRSCRQAVCPNLPLMQNKNINIFWSNTLLRFRFGFCLVRDYFPQRNEAELKLFVSKTPLIPASALPFEKHISE